MIRDSQGYFELPNVILKKGLGQHLLVDKGIAKRIVGYAEIDLDEVVLEIGPGLGALTLMLAEKAKNVIAVEKDSNLYKILEGKIPSNVTLINDDALTIDYPRFDVVVSNMPYQISSPLTFKLLKHDFRVAVLTYQKEFAERMTAGPGTKNYSRLTVNVYYRANCEILEEVPRTAFHPTPKVDGAIIKLVPRKVPPFLLEDEEQFFDITRTLFSHRRKMIKNALKEYIRNLPITHKKRPNDIKNLIQNLPFKDQRIESLRPEEIGTLSNKIYVELQEMRIRGS